MRLTKNTKDIRKFILNNVRKHPGEIVRLTTDKFGISRQAASRHISRLVEEDLLVPTGKTKGRRYALAYLIDKTFHVPITATLEEDRIWRENVRPLLDDVQVNVLAICQHGFTEMVNNVIDHSEGDLITITVKRTGASVDMLVADNGVGIFNKIAKELALKDKRDAILELAKGKLTTDPHHHTGEGIFFTSRMFEDFTIVSGELLFSHQKKDDWLFESRDKLTPGTVVFMQIHPKSKRTVTEVFNEYATPDDYTFSRTKIPLSLAQYGEDNLISRSQAKRVLARFDQFKEAFLDFNGVAMIGQAFADEIFRVFQREHPDVNLYYVNANQKVESMILRAKAAAAEE